MGHVSSRNCLGVTVLTKEFGGIRFGPDHPGTLRVFILRF